MVQDECGGCCDQCHDYRIELLEAYVPHEDAERLIRLCPACYDVVVGAGEAPGPVASWLFVVVAAGFMVILYGLL